MTPRQALAFIRKHGVVLEAAQGPVPSLAGAIAGDTLRGSWWSHPKSRQIFALTRAMRVHDDVLVCRLLGGRITYVHRRCWPALVRLAGRIEATRLAKVVEEHTSAGRHRLREVPFPKWVPPEILAEARALSEATAQAACAPWIDAQKK